jgi:phenylacetate-CoA ligase
LSFYNTLARHVLAPSLDRMRGTSTMKCLAELEESQWWPRERIEELQSERLHKLIEHAYSNVPYYRRIMQERGLEPGDIKSASDLAQLPILTKEDIRTNSRDLMAIDFPAAKLRAMATTGSTGEPLHFYGTREEQFSRGLARTSRALQWAGIEIGDRYALVGRPRQYHRRKDRLLHRLSLRFKREVEIDTGTLSQGALPLIVHRMQTVPIQALIGSPPVLVLIAGHMKEHARPIPHIRSVVSGGEQLMDHDRALLREVFETEPFSKYGSFEAYDIASECEAHAGLHVQAEDIVVETVGDDGTPTPPGMIGRILITNLHSFGMPFLRYEIGDLGSLDPATCMCGRELPRLVGTVGRRSELLVTRSGRRVFGADLCLETLGPLGVRHYRLVQEDVDNVDAYIVWREDVAEVQRVERSRQIATILAGNIGDGVSVQVRSVERIESTAGGKHLFIVSKVATRNVLTNQPQEEDS